MAKALENLTLPSDPIKQKQFKIMLNEVLASIAKVEQENEAKKDLIDEIVRQFALPKKIVSKLIATMHKHNFTDIQKENEILELLYETVVK